MARKPSNRNTLRLQQAGALCCGLILLSHVPSAAAIHHMKIRVPERTIRATDSNDTPLIVTNYCSDTIWPGIYTQSGTGPSQSGFELASGDSLNQTVSEAWQGRVWGRTNCTFNDDGSSTSGGTACGSGDCNGQLNCVVTGDNPVTLAEFTLDAGDGQTYYDISLVDGYNLPLAIVVQPLGNSSLEVLAPNLTNPSCQGTAGLLASQSYDPYSSGQQEFLGTNSSYPLAFDESVTDNQVSKWCPWNLQVDPPTKPGDGVYPYPDDNIQRPEFDPCYSACAKWNKEEDCCTGSHDSASTCSPSEYSKAAKKICPDAYSYAFDDQTSTFIIPSGAGFEVVFCPGGRSTNILAYSSGRVSSSGSSSKAIGGRRVLGLLIAMATNAIFFFMFF